jgi:DNA repair exonuclease SbcCD ATPase subunit
MDFIVEGDEKELPQKSLLSVRVGKHQRTCALREGLVISLPAPVDGETYEVKLLNEAGSKEVDASVRDLDLETKSGKVSISARPSQGAVPTKPVERNARVRSQEEADRKKYMEEKQLTPLFHSLLRACLSEMPDHPESFLVDLLKRRHPTLVKEVTIAEKIEAMEKELTSFKAGTTTAFAEKAPLEQDLARRINQLKKLDGEKRATQAKLDTTKVALAEEQQRAEELAAKNKEDARAAARDLRDLEREKDQELADLRAQLAETEGKGGGEGGGEGEEAAAEEDKTSGLEEKIATLETELVEVHAQLEQKEKEKDALERSRAALDGELKKLDKLRLAAEHFMTDASDALEIPSPREAAANEG